ncbi:MAG: hypothetical protein ACTS45_00490 [Candidatus Hodgkinia cicadicola]
MFVTYANLNVSNGENASFYGGTIINFRRERDLSTIEWIYTTVGALMV